MSEVIKKSGSKKKFDFISFSIFLAFILIIGSWAFVINVDKADFWSLFSSRNMMYAKKFLGGMVGIGEKTPAFTNIESIKTVIKLTYETLQMSILAIGFATLGMILTVIPAARNVADGSLTLSRTWYSRIVFGLIRVLYIFSRAVPELVWAMIIIFVFKPGILPGAIALALHNFGILGKLCAEVIEDLDLRPVRNLASCGASSVQMLIYGVIPSVMSKFLTYIVYRWEVIIRTTIVVGFVGAGGLGMQFKLAMSYFKYSELTLILMCYLILVWIADLVSEGSRRLTR